MRVRPGLFLGLSLVLSAAPLLALPDLIVRRDLLEGQWMVRDEKLASNACSVIEGGVSAGNHRLLRFTVSTANIGNTDIFIGDPQSHVDANDGLFELALCHQHYHFRNYAIYELIDPASGKVWKAAKRGFCMLDTDPTPTSQGGVPPGPPAYRSCGSTVSAGNQGISHGWSDTYRFYLGGQYFVLDGGDGQPPVPPGVYVIRITANPPYVPGPDGICRVLDPATGLCHQLQESNYANNILEVAVTIPSHPGRDGFGPAVGQPTPQNDIEDRP